MRLERRGVGASGTGRPANAYLANEAKQGSWKQGENRSKSKAARSDSDKMSSDAPALLASRRAEAPSLGVLSSFAEQYHRHLDEWRSARLPHADLAFGNPQHKPLRGLVDAMERQVRAAKARDVEPSFFQYTVSVPEGKAAVVDALRRTRGFEVDAEDVLLTNGALSGLMLTVMALADAGDDGIIVTPSYFLYKPMLELADIGCICVGCDDTNGFDLDVDAIREAITPRTRFILVTSPNNPTGRIYPPETLKELASMLSTVNRERAASAKESGDPYHPVMVISDEAYCRILFDGVEYHSIAEYYPYTVMIYTWGKTLLAPSERFGYIALTPLMPQSERSVLRSAIDRVRMIHWAFPNNVVARAYAEIENSNVCIDLEAMQKRRDMLCDELTAAGWNLIKPQGSFYMLVQVPPGLFSSDEELATALLGERVIALPGSMMDIPGWVRLSLTASDQMVEYAVGVFRRLMSQTSSH